MEHFHLQLVDNARGSILYRSGLPVETGNVNFDRTSEVSGMVGKPDVWPITHRDVPIHGRTGLQYRFDSILQGARGGYRGVLAKSDDMHEFYSVPRQGADIRTTIDSVWQSASERALSRASVKEGAVVLLDIRTNEILAMASISQDKFVNNAVRPFVPGSIFKLVVAAAALETHRFHQSAEFVCTGKLERPQVHMACWKVHGSESITQALEQSCDVAFAMMGMELGRYPIETLAHQLLLDSEGLQQVDGKSVLPEASRGQIFVQNSSDFGLLANTAIGQEDVRISPLQGALLAGAVANGGKIKPANLVADAEQEGISVQSFADRDSWRYAFSGSTASFLASAMKRVVQSEQGTAHDLSPLDIAVKTGTAELARGHKVNAWIIGFLPVNHPKIAFAILSANVKSATGHQQVHQIVRDLANLYKQIYPPSLIR